jgi:acyl-homoserine-lactone acylase
MTAKQMTPRQFVAACSVAICASAAGFAATAAAAAPTAKQLSAWETRAKNVTIIRDNWGIPHIYGKTDADTVFGLLYAHAEDDFNRIEMNYINAMGRLAEVAGEKEIYRDLRMRLFVDTADLQAKYRASPAWLRKLMDAYADGLNFYLAKHPEVKPKLITQFEPWMALSFTEGSIGGDIETISIKDLTEFYGKGGSKSVDQIAAAEPASGIVEPQGSNGFAIAPTNTTSGKALLLINPHTSFYFRGEAAMFSEEGLRAYGAVTWGQFFIYQGFNDKNGWMHTSGGGDVIDEYEESVIEQNGALLYKYGKASRKVTARTIAIRYKTDTGLATKNITAYFTHHGPVIRRTVGKDSKWISVKLMNEPVRALTQSYLRTKTRDFRTFNAVMSLRTNSSNNTVYADANGNIAYYHGNFVPKRDTKFDWTKPVDGSNPATEWKGPHKVSETITLFNPKTGWIQNTNNWPFSAAGSASPVESKYPKYMWTLPENARGIHAVRVLDGKKDFTIDRMIAAAYDNQLTAFETLLPPLYEAYAQLASDDPLHAKLAEPIKSLRGWDMRYAVTSNETSLAIYFAQALYEACREAAAAKKTPIDVYAAKEATSKQRVDALASAIAKLEKDFGNWKTPWGEINRFQRLSGDVAAEFDDTKPSLAVPFASGNWGSLAAYGGGTPQKTKRIYGVRGNSFVAAVEFGDRVKAKAVMAGGQNGDPKSPHFFDQAEMYVNGKFRDVLYYREEVERAAERKYKPGE